METDMKRNFSISLGLLCCGFVVFSLLLYGCDGSDSGTTPGDADEDDELGPVGDEDLEIEGGGDADGEFYPVGDEDLEIEGGGDADGEFYPVGDEDLEIEGGVERDAEELDADRPACEMPAEIPQDTPDPEQKKFALSMFHYNIQYVAGGLEVEVDGETAGLCGEACLGWSDGRLQDWIVTESFEPVLDFYLAHPEWKADFEMQAMMLEVIGERHPQVMEKLRRATHSGQIEVISFHYSAQLFMAFPEYDLARSIEMTRGIFERYCIPLSGVVFNQEGQAGEGRHAFMAEHGYAISVFPKNLYNYVRHEEPRWPYYADHGVDVVIGPGAVDPDSGIEVRWTFFDDGELLTTPLDPYFAPFTTADLSRLEDYEEKLDEWTAEGYKVTHITDYVKHLKAQDLPQPKLPPVVDGTWQPTSTDSVLRWMGGRSLAPYNNDERDNFIRKTNYQVRTDLMAARILLERAETEGAAKPGLADRLSEGWRQLFMAEVTDATGITPWIGEYLYAVSANEAAQEIADALIAELLEALDWPHAMIRLGECTAERLEDLPIPEPPEEVEPPEAIEVVIHAPTRRVDTRWTRHGEGAYDFFLTYGPAADPTGKDEENCRVAVSFSRFDEKLIYSPALMDDTIVEYDFSEFSFQESEVYLPLANGLIGLGNDWWVVKNCRFTHVAARVPNTPGEAVVQFIDETADPVEPQTWHFIVFHGSRKDALELAASVNTGPIVFKSLSQ